MNARTALGYRRHVQMSHKKEAKAPGATETTLAGDAVADALLAAGIWSGGLGLALLAAIVLVLATWALRSDRHHPAAGDATHANETPTADLPQETARRTR